MVAPDGWYWIDPSGGGASATPPSLLSLLLVLVLIATCTALATWVGRRLADWAVRDTAAARSTRSTRPTAAPLRRVERRRLARIERQLCADDPQLARMFGDLTATAPNAADQNVPSRRPQERDQ